MSGNPPDNSASGGTPTGPLQPSPPPPTYASPLPGQQVACPVCHTLVAAGARFCPQCGNAIPPQPPIWPTVSIPPSASRRNTVLIVVGVVLIVLIVLGVGGYMLYRQNQARILQDAKRSEATDANNAPYNLQVTCFSNRTDDTHLTYSVTNGYYTYYGYATVYEKFGVYNPTRFAMDVTWTITIDYPSAGWQLSDRQTFHESTNGTAYPEFSFTITGYQLTITPTHANFTVAIDGSYRVIGTYATYDPTTHETYDSATAGNTGNGPGSQNNLPKC